MARMVRPQTAVVTKLGSDHRTIYPTLESVAEKRALLAGAANAATAVLNADDPHVIAMGEGFPSRILTFGGPPVRWSRLHTATAGNAMTF